MGSDVQEGQAVAEQVHPALQVERCHSVPLECAASRALSVWPGLLPMTVRQKLRKSGITARTDNTGRKVVARRRCRFHVLCPPKGEPLGAFPCGHPAAEPSQWSVNFD